MVLSLDLVVVLEFPLPPGLLQIFLQSHISAGHFSASSVFDDEDEEEEDEDDEEEEEEDFVVFVVLRVVVILRVMVVFLIVRFDDFSPEPEPEPPADRSEKIFKFKSSTKKNKFLHSML